MKTLLVSTLAAASAALASSYVAAQVPVPNPQPRATPRAEWLVTTGVSMPAPANRHWSEATQNATSLFVFGGRTGTSGSGTKRNDLWEFDATTLTWTEHNQDGDPSAPSQRFRNACAWDPVRNRVVVFAGEDSAGTTLGDTWEWDRATNTWTDITAPGGPPARRFSKMTFDPATNTLLLFGGIDASGNALGDTWLLAGSAWVQLTPATSPPARGFHSLVTRDDFGDVLLCAGHNNAPAPNRVHLLDTWRWDGGTSDWVQIVPTTNAVPHGVAGNQAVYDSIRQRVVLHGGQGISTNATGTGGAYGTQYGGSPSGWTSEFDCVSNEWLLYGDSSFGTGDPVVGRTSRYYPAFIAATGKVYLWGGQNPSGTGVALTEVKEYQANPVATTMPFGTGCNGITLTATNAPWLGRTHTANVQGLASGSLVFAAIGASTASTPLATLAPGIGGAGCDLLVTLDATATLTNTGGVATLAIPLPNDTSLAGVVIHEQVIQFELAPIAITSSNGISLTAGAL